MEAKKNIINVLGDLSFSVKESEAFLKSIQIMKDSQLDDSISVTEKFKELVNGVINDDI